MFYFFYSNLYSDKVSKANEIHMSQALFIFDYTLLCITRYVDKRPLIWTDKAWVIKEPIYQKTDIPYTYGIQNGGLTCTQNPDS